MKNVSKCFPPILTLLIAGCGHEKPVDYKHVNILFAISDDQSYAHTSFAGSGFVNTPAFDRIASEGVYFTNCFAGSPGCAPSRSALVTGRHHWQNEQSGQHASSWLKKHVPFIDMLEANGYITGRTGKGVTPFRYARDENDSLWRATDAAGIEHSNIRYKPGSAEDERFAGGIGTVNYFENFKYFMENVRGDKPFFFWYGAQEPHREYEKDSWKRSGKNLADAEVPGFFPDHEIIRGDLLDYAIEIEWFDLHLQRMLDYLEEIGELENTIVIVTSDNGMPFPRAKANNYLFGVKVPFAVRFPNAFIKGRIIDDPIGFADIAPTILDITKSSHDGMLPISGKSFLNILESDNTGMVDDSRKYVLSGRERHSSSRHENLGYPVRAIHSKNYTLIWNMKPELWPAGDPQAVKSESDQTLLPMYGIDNKGVHHSEWAFTDIDESPSKAYIIENWNTPSVSPFFDLAHARRNEFELFDTKKDPYCMNNVIGINAYSKVEMAMKKELMHQLITSEDARMVGPDREVFDSYIRYSGPMRYFPSNK